MKFFVGAVTVLRWINSYYRKGKQTGEGRKRNKIVAETVIYTVRCVD